MYNKLSNDIKNEEKCNTFFKKWTDLLLLVILVILSYHY